MNKIVPVLGVAAAMTLAGCKDPNYRRFGESSQTEPTSIVDQAPVNDQTAVTPEPTPIQTVDLTPDPIPVPEPTPVTVASTPVEPETTTYIVQKGDYLGKIAATYKLKVADIKILNNLKSDKILLGQKLKLPGKIDVGVQTVPEGAKAVKDAGAKPGKKAFEPYTGETAEYVVKSGDTLGKLAYGNGINIRQLKALNNLKSDSLKIGQKLRIPAKGAVQKPAASVAEPVVKATPAPQKSVSNDAVAVAPVAEPVQSAAVPATVPGETTYIVQENEDLLSIAVSMGLSPAVLREMNNLPEDAVLTAGQTLKVPADSQE